MSLGFSVFCSLYLTRPLPGLGGARDLVSDI
uniref:Uncharacterized protein n=1 Tax=Rhizophora mucronata TaxID=61149 RepID=A0A2P2PFK4_RHIMU